LSGPAAVAKGERAAAMGAFRLSSLLGLAMVPVPTLHHRYIQERLVRQYSNARRSGRQAVPMGSARPCGTPLKSAGVLRRFAVNGFRRLLYARGNP